MNNSQAQVIELPMPKKSITPTEFYIEKIIDERLNQSGVAKLLFQGNPNQHVIFDLKNGFKTSLMKYVEKSINQNMSLRPVSIRVYKYNIAEISQGKNAAAGDLDIHFSFEFNRDGEYIKLIEYKAKVSYTRSLNDNFAATNALAKAISQSLIYFNTWINSQSKSDENLAIGVKFNFKNYINNEAVDTLFYNSKNPLTWLDFKSKPVTGGNYAATIFSFFAVDSKNELVNSIVELNINLKVYLVRSFSWVKDFARNSYTLNHEQRHFDIVKIISERFKSKLLKEQITVANYEGIISFEYIESLRELDKMQKLYDSETQNGSNPAMQKIWNERIDKELAGFTAMQ